MSIKRSIILKDKVLLVFFVLSFFLLLLSLIFLYFNIGSLNSPIILHFDGLKGIDFFGKAGDLWFVWLTGFVAVLINFFLGNVFFYRERIMTYLFSGGSFLLSLLLLVVVVQIISIN